MEKPIFYPMEKSISWVKSGNQFSSFFYKAKLLLFKLHLINFFLLPNYVRELGKDKSYSTCQTKLTSHVLQCRYVEIQTKPGNDTKLMKIIYMYKNSKYLIRFKKNTLPRYWTFSYFVFNMPIHPNNYLFTSCSPRKNVFGSRTLKTV